MSACVVASQRLPSRLSSKRSLASFLRPAPRPQRRGDSLLQLVVRAGWNDVSFKPATISSNKAVTASPVLNRMLVDVGAEATSTYALAGQFVQVKMDEEGKAGFFAIASAPDANNAGVIELLVKASGDPAEALCAAGEGTRVLVSDVMGKGFPVDRVHDVDNVYIFCTGSGISPIKALIESGTLHAEKRNVTLYYGARNKEAMAYFDSTGEWEKTGVKVVPVFSEGGVYVQDQFQKDGGIIDVDASCAILCGQKEMAESIKAIFGDAGVAEDRILTNF
jgi:NAD(P)H-flavin reductase